MRSTNGLCLALLFAFACGDDTPPPIVTGPPEPPVSYVSLLREVASLDELAAPRGERTWQSSSFDPASDDPAELTLTSWFANADHGNFHGTVRVAGRRELVMAHVEGPGVLTRIWSANPMGTLRIYVDDLDVPAIEASMEALLSGEDPRFPEPFAYVAGEGYTFLAPVPFSERLRVTADEGERPASGVGLYFHVGYRVFTAGTEVEPWSEALHAASADVREEVRQRLEDPRRLETGRREPFALRAGEPFTLEGPATIRALTLRPERYDEATLRAAVLSIAFDGVETVRAPLGDFFGHGPGLVPFQTLVTEMDDDGTLVTRFPMPFAREATITVESPTPLSIEGELRVDAPIETPWRFFARWRDEGLGRSQPRRDLRIAGIAGEGAFVGLVYQIGNGEHSWWGEGDEKIYIDGETFPSWFGTGTEDYFGYAFCSLEAFARPTHAQTNSASPDRVGNACRPDVSHRGRVSNVRWHAFDPIRFSRGLVFDLELWHWWFADVSIRTLSYWYGDPSAANDFEELAPGSELESVESLRTGMLPDERFEP